MIKAIELRMGKLWVDEAAAKIAQAQRDENCALGFPSVKKEGLRDKTVAIVGFGPSLVDTLPQLISLRGQFDAIWTVSKSHDYLIERGIIPSHHTDTHYDAGKAQYNVLFNDQTAYLMATQVHPSYLDKLKPLNVSLFHVVHPSATFDCRYFKSPATFDAGLQAAQLAYELGYRNQEWFGMDACARPGMTHAGAHEGWKPEQIEVEVAGKAFIMNDFLLRQALFAELLLHERPRMKVRIYGDGALRPFLLERGRCIVG